MMMYKMFDPQPLTQAAKQNVENVEWQMGIY
jgi:hypothetical protein